jgi:filamentous hemagglutinin
MTSEQFSSHIENIINNPSDVKILSNGRIAYWDDANQTVVIRNPSAADGGTAFKPTQGKTYFNNLK